MSTEAVQTVTEPFYFNLAEIDPTIYAIPQDTYTLRASKVMLDPEKVCKKGAPDEHTKPMVKIQFTVVNHPNYSGRKLWKTFWLPRDRDQFPEDKDYDAKDLHLWCNAVGMMPAPDRPLQEWVDFINQQQPEVVAFVTNQPQIDYKTRQKRTNPATGEADAENVINFRQLKPV